jgi:hypothetical protein
MDMEKLIKIDDRKKDINYIYKKIINWLIIDNYKSLWILKYLSYKSFCEAFENIKIKDYKKHYRCYLFIKNEISEIIDLSNHLELSISDLINIEWLLDIFIQDILYFKLEKKIFLQKFNN